MSEEKYRGVECDDLRLLQVLCKMANMSQAGVQKAVLVCEVGAAPVIYVQSLLQPVSGAAEAELLEAGRGAAVEQVLGIVVDTTTMQNEAWMSLRAVLWRQSELPEPRR